MKEATLRTDEADDPENNDRLQKRKFSLTYRNRNRSSGGSIFQKIRNIGRSSRRGTETARTRRTTERTVSVHSNRQAQTIKEINTVKAVGAPGVAGSSNAAIQRASAISSAAPSEKN